MRILSFLFLTLLLLTGCEDSRMIITDVSEKEANLILVLLESRGIPATKTASASTAVGGGGGGQMFSISVDDSKTIDAIAILNQNGLPKEKGTTLLDLFAKQGLMTTEKEETIRYHAGLAQEIKNSIMMIDGVIDCTVQLSFPPEQLIPGEETKKEPITAAVYVKHQGVVDDPNAHLENKIKRLVSGSITGLTLDDVTVVSDRSRLTDITVQDVTEHIAAGKSDYVKVWSMVMSRSSVGKFRFLFFLLLILLILFGAVAGWLVWKLYPQLKKKGAKEILNPLPMTDSGDESGNPPQPPTG